MGGDDRGCIIQGEREGGRLRIGIMRRVERGVL